MPPNYPQVRRKKLEKSKGELESEFEKTLKYVSSGALTFTLFFIEKIVKLPEASTKFLLICGVVLLASSLLLTLLADQISKMFVVRHIKNFDHRVDNDTLMKGILRKNRVIDNMNWIILALISSGIISIIVFIGINLP